MKKNNIISFLQELSTNNNKEWFDAHKPVYLEAKKSMELLVNQVIQKISAFDSSISDQEAKKCLFRIYRDVRFSKNKEPYKTNMGAFIVPGGKKSGKAGYYVHIEPSNSFLGGGIYMPESKILKLVREEVMFGIDEFHDIIKNPDFNAVFSKIHGEKLKRPPKGFPADFKDIELLKLKSFALMHPISERQIIQDDFVDYSSHVFNQMMPFNLFINRAFD